MTRLIIPNSCSHPSSSFTAGSEVIAVIVGKGDAQIKHLVHENILRKCQFFDKCLSAGMKESQEKIITLPEDEPGAIDVVVTWLYCETLPANIDSTVGASVSYYNTADKYGLPEQQNALLDQCRTGWNGLTLHPLHVLMIWKRSPEGSRLRQAALAQLRWNVVTSLTDYKGNSERAWGLKQLLRNGGELSETLFMMMADTLVHGRNIALPNPSQMTGCVYHVHEDGKNCS